MKRRLLFKKNIKFIKNKKTYIILIIMAIFWVTPTFAQTTTAKTGVLADINIVLEVVINFLSRGRILLATLAGKLMTNDLVYGASMHLDVYLWKLRNICKNFANFGLLGLLLRGIIQSITKGASISDTVKKTLLSGILIQASWFILAAVLDISTILTSGIATFPSHFIDSEAYSKSTLMQNINQAMENHILKLDANGTPSIVPTTTSSTGPTKMTDKILEKILPSNDSVGGPLVYIGATTLKIQNIISGRNNANNTIGSTVKTSFLSFLMIAIYCISLILLIITNIIRIGLLWLIIPLSPIIALMAIWGKSMGKDGIFENFKIGVILHAIFKPVIFTGILSLILIFIVTIQGMLTTDNNRSITIQGTTIAAEAGVATIESNGIFSTTIKDSIFDNVQNIPGQAVGTVKGIFSNIIVYFATVFLLWYLVKEGAKMGGGTIGDVMGKAIKLTENMASTAPIFRGQSIKSYTTASNNAITNMGKTAGINTSRDSSSFGTATKAEDRFNEYFSNKFGDNTGFLSQETRSLEGAKDITTFITATKAIETKIKSSPSNFDTREIHLNNKFAKDNSRNDYNFKNPNTTRTLENLSPDGRTKFCTAMGISPTITTYKDFKNHFKQ